MKKLNPDLPILLIGYSRLENIQITVQKLIKMSLSNIYIALDFSNDGKVQIQQQKMVENLENLYGNEIKIWYRQKNHGVGVGIITAIDWFFASNEKGIILEDDLVFNLSFLIFCAEAFKHYRKEEIFMISGNRFDHATNSDSVAITNYPQIWGWATWRENWLEMRTLITKHKSFRIECLWSPRKAFFCAGAMRVRRGMIDTWDIPLAYEMLILNKICLLPPVNLVSNIGSDRFAVHTRNRNFPLNFPILEPQQIVFAAIEKAKSDSRRINTFLEKKVFQIKNRHLFSPLKLSIMIVYHRMSGREFRTLASRLEDAENFV